MMLQIYFKLVFILIVLQCRGLSGQIDVCNLSTIAYAHNICDNPNYMVYISESVCGTSGGANCWCIIVDNRYQQYDGYQLEIEMDNSFRVTWMQAKRTHIDVNAFDLKFIITPGVNRIFFQPFTTSSPAPKLLSFKINHQDICNSLNRRKKQIFGPYKEDVYSEPNDVQVQVLTQSKQPQQIQDSQDDYRYLNDCIQRRTYTSNSVRYCPYSEDSNNFVIEKRYFTRGEQYWCINVGNEKNVFSASNRLRIAYSSQNKYLAWIPSDSYIQQSTPDSNFHLGNRRTFVAVSVQSGELPDLNSVTIDGRSICNYFNPPVAAPPPTRPPPPPPTRPPQTTPQYIPPPQYEPPVTPQYQPQPIESIQNKPNFNKNCGVKPPRRVTLISHGAATNPGDWPWHAAIYKLQSKTNRNYICGGTLIDRKTIVTAAHCVLDLNLVIIPDRIIVELGRYDLSLSSPATQEFKVFDVIPHEAFNPETIENDIAILVLANYVQITSYVSFICLPEPNLNLQNQIGKTVGWGRDQSNQLQTELKEASMPVIDNIVCLSSNREFFGQYLTNTNFCAGYRNNTNVCRGDSGGGLVFKVDNQWFLGGVTSLGVSSKSTELECDITQYAIFTDVTKFVKWIKQNA